MHFKYSAILNVTFVTFMYGLAIPLLFPIALLFFIIQYCVEKLCITYYYKKPPMYDEKLNLSAIATLKWAPVFMMLFGYWIMGNRQIFHNYVHENVNKTDPIITNHTGFDIVWDQSLPLLILGMILAVSIFFNDLIIKVLAKFKLAKEDKEAEVDEKLGTYVRCLSLDNRLMWRIEEIHMRKMFGIQTITDEMLTLLKDNKPHNKTIKTCHNYEVTSNPKYAAAF